MVRLALRATLTLVISALLGSVAIFVLLRALRGDVAVIILGETATPESIAALRTKLGLDRPLPEQYVDWLLGFLTGDFGESYASGFDLAGQLGDRVGLTFTLAVAAMFVSWVVAIVAGTYAAMNARKLRGAIVDGVAQVGIAVPSMWVGLVLILVFAISLGWVQGGGYTPWGSGDPVATIRSLILPVTSVSIALATVNTRYVRAAMLEILNEDYIRTARSKGLTIRRAAIRHGVRNASISLVTVGVLQLGGLLSGVVVTENVFALPGLGRMLVEAIYQREVVVVQSLAFMILLLTLLLNFVMDLAYGLIDPRIRDNVRMATNG